MNPILTAAETAKLLCCSVRTVEDHARAGRLPGVKFGDGWIFSADLLIEAVKKLSLEAVKPKADSAPKAVGMVPAKPKQRGHARALPGLELLPADVQALVAGGQHQPSMRSAKSSPRSEA